LGSAEEPGDGAFDRTSTESEPVSDVNRRFLLNALKLFDVTLVFLCFGITTFLVASAQQSVPLAQFLSMRVKLSNCAIFAVALFLSHIMFSMCGLYESKRLSTRRAEVLDGLKATALSTVCLAAVSAFFSLRVVTTPKFLLLFWAIVSLVLTASRMLLRYWLASARRDGHNLRHILILGTNARAIQFARKIAAAPEQGYRLVGFVDDDWPLMHEFEATGFRLASDFAGVAEFLRCNVVDEVAIYLPLRSYYQHAAQMAAVCEQQGIILRFDSDIFNLKLAKPRIVASDGDPKIATPGMVNEGWPFLFKRAIDLSMSLAAIIILAPLLLVIAALIKVTSPGSVFFQQKRVGLNKRQFTMYKFRTMVPDAEKIQETLQHLNEMTGPVFKIKNDPRITPIGRILRKTSIDELPQLFNVLKGDMSLVGPRAMSVRDYQSFNEDWQRRRFSVPPGITCLWQIKGRNSLPFEQWMELDMEYIDSWSIWLDLQILARTIPAVLKGSGAA
jgi:exopolysaccharide biosynthesis polyprenyl glycosylphosphotransferase